MTELKTKKIAPRVGFSDSLPTLKDFEFELDDLKTRKTYKHCDCDALRRGAIKELKIHHTDFFKKTGMVRTVEVENYIKWKNNLTEEDLNESK